MYDTRMLCRQWIWLKRFRHRRGYGVHSPFAFDFLTYVVYERGEYYAYRELKKRYPVVCLCGGLHRLKCRKFLFSSVQLRASLADPDIWARERGGNGLLGSGMPFGRGMPGLVLEGEGTGERRFRAAEGTDGRGEGDCAPALDGCGFASVDKVFGVPPFRHTGFKSGFAGVERRETLAGSRRDFRSL